MTDNELAEKLRKNRERVHDQELMDEATGIYQQLSDWFSDKDIKKVGHFLIQLGGQK